MNIIHKYTLDDIRQLQTIIKDDGYNNQFQCITNYFNKNLSVQPNLIDIINMYTEIFDGDDKKIITMLKYVIEHYQEYKQNIYEFILNTIQEIYHEIDFFYILQSDIINDMIHNTDDKDLICEYITFLLKNNTININDLSELIKLYESEEYDI
jgi:hypothetical protein